ncbi:glycoside hydrolase family 3 N-terminal domain-containing protein [Alkalicoccobacillus porphyridii]|uniref:beta-glucosidase n=1 Tax=Alkalicoccobacillus porphyridii TaxID=2597270 RepID=A0A553ZVZ4_9BACI|nr:glycoside hydrolase family 3 N-terminal domain-containing protein [Alkalicoccobacillus porphyridii]TSB45602.1 beta-glucosidase [Alkalicoccobacillus porphyridii]
MNSEQIQQLIAEMTLEEKVGQLTQFAGVFYSTHENDTPLTGRIDFPVNETIIEASGSVLGIAGAKKLIDIQEMHLQKSRLKIPLLFMADVINGYETIFPIPLGLGSTWDPELVEELQAVSAKEAASAGLHVSFAPMVDLVRDPRWGRVMESTGEDPYLNEQFAEATVRGLQGSDLLHNMDHIAACVKHFAAYGAAEAGRDYNTVDLSERELREMHMPAYIAALNAGVKLVMTAFNTVHSIPASANTQLLRGMLRKEYGFDGVVISDYGAVQELIPHGVAENEEEAAEKALRAGVDIDMMSLCYAQSLSELIHEKKLDESLLDEAVERILQLKNDLGLFEDPYRATSEEREQATLGHASHKQLARKAAEKSAVLLKNENVLPLQDRERLALIGPYADNNDLLGEWSIFGKMEDTATLKDKLEPTFYAKGAEMYERNQKLLDEALHIANQADIIVLALGEGRDRSGEGRSRASITLAPCQIELAKKLKELGKPIVVTLFNARPLDLSELEPYVDAILECWHPGSEGAAAIINLLFGKANPSGKLTMSFPRATGQIPVYYNSYQTGRPLPAGSDERFFSRYIDIANEPLYPFGFGLSYAAFEYSQLRATNLNLQKTETLTVEVDVTNTSDVAGEEIVQLYLQDPVAEVVRPVKELKGFKKILLAPHETKTITFEINEEMLRYHHSDLTYSSDPGTFFVYINGSSKCDEANKLELQLIHS